MEGGVDRGVCEGIESTGSKVTEMDTVGGNTEEVFEDIFVSIVVAQGWLLEMVSQQRDNNREFRAC